MKHQQLQTLIQDLKKASIEHDSGFWKRIATDLEKPTKGRSVVNLSKIEMFAKDNDTVIVPGKVLGMGDLSKKVVIAAYNFSKSALDKIPSSGSKAISISDLLKKNPKGKKVTILK